MPAQLTQFTPADSAQQRPHGGGVTGMHTWDAHCTDVRQYDPALPIEPAWQNAPVSWMPVPLHAVHAPATVCPTGITTVVVSPQVWHAVKVPAEGGQGASRHSLQ